MKSPRSAQLRARAAASALAALGLPDRGLAAAPLAWVKGTCDACACRCRIEVAREAGEVVAVRGDPDGPHRGLLCLEGFLLPERLAAAPRAGGGRP